MYARNTETAIGMFLALKVIGRQYNRKREDLGRGWASASHSPYSMKHSSDTAISLSTTINGW